MHKAVAFQQLPFLLKHMPSGSNLICFRNMLLDNVAYLGKN